jgi:aryl-alcohol dehydrogenase-like predicted oxidoreductase
MLSGKYRAESRMSPDEVRGAGHSWVSYFKDGKPVPAYLEKLDAVREILTSGGRTLTQGALAWIWAKSPNTIPIPGFKNERQAVENAKAMESGPLTREQFAESSRFWVKSHRAVENARRVARVNRLCCVMRQSGCYPMRGGVSGRA